MIFTIIGAQRKQGNYDGKEYDNVTLRVIYQPTGDPVTKGMEFGDRVAEYKVKSQILSLEKAYDYYKNKTPLEIYFDQYGNAIMFIPVKK